MILQHIHAGHPYGMSTRRPLRPWVGPLGVCGSTTAFLEEGKGEGPASAGPLPHAQAPHPPRDVTQPPRQSTAVGTWAGVLPARHLRPDLLEMAPWFSFLGTHPLQFFFFKKNNNFMET